MAIEDLDLIESEFEFNQWLESIEFVNKKGVTIDPVLFIDESDDLELDRGE